VTQVEELKSVVRLLPIWASGIVSTAVLAYALYGSTAVLAYALSVAPREATRASGKDSATALHLVAAGGAANAVAATATHLLLAAGASTKALSASGLRAGDLLPRAATAAKKPLRPPAQVPGLLLKSPPRAATPTAACRARSSARAGPAARATAASMRTGCSSAGSCTPHRLPWRLHGLEHAAATAVGPGPHFRPHQAEATMVATHLTPAVRGMEEASICPSSGTPRGHLPHLRWADPSPPTHFPGFFEVSLYSFFARFRGYFLSLTLK
jgi:hypothetical protein